MKTIKNIIMTLGKLMSWLWMILVFVICFGKQYVPFTIKGLLIVLMFNALPIIFLSWRSVVERQAKDDKLSKKQQKRLSKKQAKVNKKEKRLTKKVARKRKRQDKKLNKKQGTLNKLKKQLNKKTSVSTSTLRVEPTTIDSDLVVKANVQTKEVLNTQRYSLQEVAQNEIPQVNQLEDSSLEAIDELKQTLNVKSVNRLPKGPLVKDDMWIYEFEKVTKLNPIAYVILGKESLSIRHDVIEELETTNVHGPIQISYEDIEHVNFKMSSFPIMGTLHLTLKENIRPIESATTLGFTEQYLDLGRQVVEQINAILKSQTTEESEEMFIIQSELPKKMEENELEVALNSKQEEGLSEEDEISIVKSEAEFKNESSKAQSKLLTDDIIAQLKAYKELLDLDIITKEEFDKKKTELLS